MATVFARGDMYYVEYRLDGKVKKRSTKVKVSEGLRKARKASEAIIKGESLENDNDDKGKMRLKEAIDKAYRQKWSKNKDDVGPMQKARVILEVLGKDIFLDEIDSLAVSNLQEELFERNISPATINRYSSVLKLIFNLAVEQWGLKLSKPHIPKHKERKGRLRYLSDDEEVFLLDYLVNKENKLEYAHLFACLLDTGMRFSELNDIQYEDINLDEQAIHCWRNKGDRPRTIPMTERVYNILSERKKLYGGLQPFGCSYDSVHHYFIKSKIALGKEDDNDLCIHSLRHTCASRLVQRGVDLYIVKEILGHSNITVTEKYAHLKQDSLRKAMAVLESTATTKNDDSTTNI